MGIDEQNFEIYNECDILTATCTVNAGDIIRVAGTCTWNNGTPMSGVEVFLQFRDYYGGSKNNVRLEYEGEAVLTNSVGWFSANHTVTAADIDGLGDTGWVELYTFTNPRAWGGAHPVYYEEDVTDPNFQFNETGELTGVGSFRWNCGYAYNMDVICEDGVLNDVPVDKYIYFDMHAENTTAAGGTCRFRTVNADTGLEIKHYDKYIGGNSDTGIKLGASKMPNNQLNVEIQVGWWDGATFHKHETINKFTFNPPTPPTLTISPTTHNSPAAGDTFTVTITSNVSWSITDNKTWLSCSPVSGSDDGSTTVIVAANTGTASRTGTVTVAGGGITCTCVITQAGTTLDCDANTDKDTYEQGEIITITYSNAPTGSTLSVADYPGGTAGQSWPVSGGGTETYTIPDDAPTGTWELDLWNGSCSVTKYFTVTAAAEEDTEIVWVGDVPTEASVNEEVTLAIRITTDGYVPKGVNNLPIYFYANGTKLNIDPIYTTDSPFWGLNGYAEVKHSFSEVGTYTIKAVFYPTEEYNGSECISTLTVTPAPVAIGEVYSYSPHSKEVGVGSTVTVKIKGKNVGDGAGDICLAVARTDTAEVLIHEVVTNIPKDGLTEEYTNTFTMPDNEVKLLFDVGHIENGLEVYDDEERATLTPKGIPEKDTEIVWVGDVPTEASVNEEVTLAIRITTDGYVPKGVNNLPIYFYANGTKLNIDPIYTTDSPFWGLNGYAEVKHSFSEVGTYTLKAKFLGVTGYNPSESDPKTLTVTDEPECDKGAIVTVKDVPTEGLRVQTSPDAPFTGCSWGLIPTISEETVTQDNPIAVFSNLYTDTVVKKACFRVVTMDYDSQQLTGYVMSTKEGFVVPESGCNPIAMQGYYGKPYRCRMTAEPSNPKPGEGFWLTAHLTTTPNGEAAEPDLPVTFYRVVGETREEIGTPGTTDDRGIARKAWSEPTAGTYKYEAEYDPSHAITFIEPVTVTVAEKTCPIDISALEECPILKALQGTLVLTHLDTLRWYRDTKMSPTLVKSYYKLIPITGRIARHSRIARTIVRALSTFSIRKIERRWGGEIPYLQTL